MSRWGLNIYMREYIMQENSQVFETESVNFTFTLIKNTSTILYPEVKLKKVYPFVNRIFS